MISHVAIVDDAAINIGHRYFFKLEIEENNRMGKTRDLFKKTEVTK